MRQNALTEKDYLVRSLTYTREAYSDTKGCPTAKNGNFYINTIDILQEHIKD